MLAKRSAQALEVTRAYLALSRLDGARRRIAVGDRRSVQMRRTLRRATSAGEGSGPLDQPPIMLAGIRQTDEICECLRKVALRRHIISSLNRETRAHIAHTCAQYGAAEHPKGALGLIQKDARGL